MTNKISERRIVGLHEWRHKNSFYIPMYYLQSIYFQWFPSTILVRPNIAFLSKIEIFARKLMISSNAYFQWRYIFFKNLWSHGLVLIGKYLWSKNKEFRQKLIVTNCKNKLSLKLTNFHLFSRSRSTRESLLLHHRSVHSDSCHLSQVKRNGTLFSLIFLVVPNLLWPFC